MGLKGPLGLLAVGSDPIQVLLDIHQDGVVMIGSVPVDACSFGTAFNHHPDIGLPGEFVLRERTEVSEDILRVLVKRVDKMSRHDKEATAEAPVDAVHVHGSAKGPASWNGQFGEGGLIHLSEFVQEALLVFYNFEDAVI